MFTKGTQKLRLLKKQQLNEKQEFTYDVFISYSDADRAWVLDELITHLEGTADIRVCFHERDFLVMFILYSSRIFISYFGWIVSYFGFGSYSG